MTNKYSVEYDYNSDIIKNSIKCRPKGHLTKSDSKRIKSIIEDSNTKTQYKCK
ncbi:10347_t:CDS:1, partial [Scutellospora calospora]